MLQGTKSDTLTRMREREHSTAGAWHRNQTTISRGNSGLNITFQ